MKGMANRRWALAMLLIEVMGAFVFLEIYVIPAAIAILAIVGASLKIHFDMKRVTVFVLAFLLLIVPYIRLSYFPIVVGQYTFTIGVYGPVAAEYMLVIQLLLFHWRRINGISGSFSILGGLVIMCAGDQRVNYPEYALYQSLVLLYLGMLVGAAASVPKRIQVGAQHRRGRFIIAGVLLFTMVASSAVSFGLYRYQYELDAAFSSLAYPLNSLSGVELRTESKLGSVAATKASGKTKVALRILSDESPGYLRAHAFDQYDPPSWANSTPTRNLKAMNDEFALEGYTRYGIPQWLPGPSSGDDLILREIWPVSGSGATVFTQTHTPFIELDDILIYGNGHAITSSGNRVAGSNYRLYVNPTRRAAVPDTSMRYRLLDLPGTLDPRLEALAESIFEGATTPQEKIHRVVTYFQANHTYALGIDIPEGVDPLTYFLLERPPAHC